MNREEIIRMALEAGMSHFSYFVTTAHVEDLERFAALVAAAECKAMMQLFTDPENQPTQHGTVTVEYMQREIAAEREACATVVEQTKWSNWFQADCAAAIRARGNI